MFGRLSDSDVSTNVPHAKRACHSAVHEKSTTAELVNEDEEPDEGDAGLDDTEDAGGEERGVRAIDANRLEHSR